jgi:hypothetical protein
MVCLRAADGCAIFKPELIRAHTNEGRARQRRAEPDASAVDLNLSRATLAGRRSAGSVMSPYRWNWPPPPIAMTAVTQGDRPMT